MNEEQGGLPGAVAAGGGVPAAAERAGLTQPVGPAGPPAREAPAAAASHGAGSPDAGSPDAPAAVGPDGASPDAGSSADRPARLPLLPGFREMALRRMAQDRGRLMRELASRRQEAGLSQTQIAARMGTSQSAVARLEAGEADARASTMERYAAALGAEITWTLQGGTGPRRKEELT